MEAKLIPKEFVELFWRFIASRDGKAVWQAVLASVIAGLVLRACGAA